MSWRSLDFSADTAMPYLQNAGIPTMDGGGQPLFYTSPVSFITNDLSADASGGYLALLEQAGCKSVAAIEALAGDDRRRNWPST